jgi:hypothetical protein
VTDLRSLQERIGGLTGPSLEVNCDLEEHFGEWTNLGGGWRRHKVTGERERYTYVPAPPYTASVDAALALVERLLPDWDWIVGHTNDGLTIHCRLGQREMSFGHSAPLAVLAALLSALAAETGAALAVKDAPAHE